MSNNKYFDYKTGEKCVVKWERENEYGTESGYSVNDVRMSSWEKKQRRTCRTCQHSDGSHPDATCGAWFSATSPQTATCINCEFWGGNYDFTNDHFSCYIDGVYNAKKALPNQSCSDFSPTTGALLLGIRYQG